jgi:ABC-type branched-subunit amino acid transport system ATPase component
MSKIVKNKNVSELVKKDQNKVLKAEKVVAKEDGKNSVQPDILSSLQNTRELNKLSCNVVTSAHIIQSLGSELFRRPLTQRESQALIESVQDVSSFLNIISLGFKDVAKAEELKGKEKAK